MKPIDLAFFRTIAVGLGSFGLAGGAIALIFPTMPVVIVVDRAFCAPDQWQQTAAAYRDRYQAHQQKQISIKRLVLVGDLGEESLTPLPTPEAFVALPTFGRSNKNALAQWQQGKALPPDFQGARIEFLGCGSQPSSVP